MSPFRLEVVTAEEELFAGDVDILIAPGREGQLAILPHHAPLLTQLGPGLLEIRTGGEAEELAVSGGFLEILGNRAVVLADAAERAEDIDIDRAEAAMKRAQERVASHDSDVDLERALAQVARARTRVAVARKRRRPERV
ncbi:MAG: F0F1 ATP synthase subunit epsilon [Chloroflexi bacterium]|nr:F0F1 ATP synthase subunit epsilon [Chloroflexota bacterium]MCH8101561.1 F0F1 ATP synthase subunit epsilon [Chloroflexota bacterium]